MSELQKIAAETNAAQVGKQVRVLVEETQPVGDWRGYDLVAAR